MIKHFNSKEFLIFLIVGAIAATFNFSSRIFFNRWLNFSFSIILAYVVGMCVGYILFRVFVFRKSRQRLSRSILLFFLVNMFAVFQTWLVSVTLAYYFLPMFGVVHFVKEISHAIGVIVPMFTSYIGHKKLTFSEG